MLREPFFNKEHSGCCLASISVNNLGGFDAGYVLRQRMNGASAKEAENKTIRKHRSKELTREIMQHDHPPAKGAGLSIHAVLEESVTFTQHQRIFRDLLHRHLGAIDVGPVRTPTIRRS